MLTGLYPRFRFSSLPPLGSRCDDFPVWLHTEGFPDGRSPTASARPYRAPRRRPA